MATVNMFDLSNAIPFAGAEYDAARDRERLTKQVDCIRAVAIDGKWRTIERLTAELRKAFPTVRFPENSVSAQLRNLKKIGYGLNRQNIIKGGCLFQYQLVAPEVKR